MENMENWDTIVPSIDNKAFSRIPSKRLTIKTKRNIEGLATEFANKLIQQKGGNVKLIATPDVLNLYRHLHVSNNQPERPIEPPVASVTSDVIIDEQPLINETLTHIVILASSISRVSHDVEIVYNRDQHNPRRFDMDKSCCDWSISNIAEYFNVVDCVDNLEIPTDLTSFQEDFYEMVQTDIRCRSEIARGIELAESTYPYYSDLFRIMIPITSTETGSRFVLEALLVPLCSSLDLKLEVGKSIYCNFLPNCIFDYCIRKGEHIIGCIKAASVKRLTSDSVAQAILQLIILQTTLMETATSTVVISAFPLFAIVTDGHRFIYMQLIGSSLRFENGRDQLRIREVREEGDFKDILNHIRFLVRGN
jgi:hypothetical protein